MKRQRWQRHARIICSVEERRNETPNSSTAKHRQLLAGARSRTHPLGSVTRDRLAREAEGKWRPSVRSTVFLSPTYCPLVLSLSLSLSRSLARSLALSHTLSTFLSLSTARVQSLSFLSFFLPSFLPFFLPSFLPLYLSPVHSLPYSLVLAISLSCTLPFP